MNPTIILHPTLYWLPGYNLFNQPRAMVKGIVQASKNCKKVTFYKFYSLSKSICWSPNWNGPQTDSGTPRFGILTHPYPNRFGESQNQFGDCFFCVFFSHTQHRPFLTKQTTTQQKLQLSPFLMRVMRWGAPRSNRRALTPRCPPTRQKRRGRGFRRGGGRGGGRLGDLPAPAGACRRRCCRRRSRLCRVDCGVVDACVGGCLFVPGGELNEIKKSKKTHTNQPKTHARDAGGKCDEVRPVRSEGGARFDRWGRSSWARGV